MDELKKKQRAYNRKNEFLDALHFEVSPEEFYRELFPEGTFERKGIQEDGKPNGIVLEFEEGKRFANREIITDDHKGLLRTRNGFTIYSPIGYYGKNRTGANARYLYALVFDLDGVDMKHLRDLLHQMKNDVIPPATYLVNSGTGFHVYYFLEEPVPMYPENQKHLRLVKHALTGRIWNDFTSKYRERQQQGIMQGFRVVGTPTKLGADYPVTAFAMCDKRYWTIEKLYDYVPEITKKELLKKAQFRKMTLEEAKAKYPDWYERRVVKDLPKGRWVVKRDLYDWWHNKIKKEIKVGHRYFAIMTLAIYAKKCNINEEELYEDAFGLLEPYEKLTIENTNHFVREDIVAALEMFNEDYVTFPRREIAKLSGLEIPANKRNFRKQAIHLKGARAIQEINDEDKGTNWRNTNGRPTKEQEVSEWQKINPDGRKADCVKETGLSKTTVYKYWKK